jgi:serine/threonine-protein kinase
VKVYVDGADQGPLPARVVELAPGTHRLRFSGGERYVSLDRTVDVFGGRIQDIGEIRLPVRLGRITVDVATPGTRVLIVRDGARKVMRGPWPMTLDVDATQGWKLQASAPGHRDLVQPLTFADGQPLQTIKIDLSKR